MEQSLQMPKLLPQVSWPFFLHVLFYSNFLDIRILLLKWIPFSSSKAKWFTLTFNSDFRVSSNSKVNVHETCELVS